MEERLEAAGGELLAHRRNGVATVTLNRPAALNALTFGMLEGLAAWMEAWAADDRVKIIVLRGAGDKAFCAGGDVRALHEGFHAGRTDLLDFFVVEYALDYRIHTFPKPVVAVMDGIVMGGGMGLAQGAALRIVGDRTKMGMPETAIGLFPDVGGSWFLSRSPGALGNYLGLVGSTIRASDTLYAGLADGYFPPDALAALPGALEYAAKSSDPRAAVRAIGKDLASIPPGEPELKLLRSAIDTHFEKQSLEAIVESLHSITDPALAPWRDKTLEALSKRSPTMLAVTLEQLRRGKTLTLGDVFRMELGMVQASLEHGDFIEGVRALLVDKDNAPHWKTPTPEAVARFFAPRWNDHPLKQLN